MKKTYLALLLMTIPILVSAQFKVSSIGKTAIGNSTLLSNTNLSITPGILYPEYTHNLDTRLYPTAGLYNTGITVNAYSSSEINSGRSTGIQGVAGNLSMNYGVIGALTGTKSGAGIYGTLSSVNGNAFTGQYAGYFQGDTYVNGTLTASSVIAPSDIRLKENVTLLSNEETKPDETVSNIMGMNVIKYNYIERPSADADTAVVIMNKSQVPKQVHYGLSAQELQEIYPDLVVEGQDGYLGINYVELVPILIRSIQELKQELDGIKSIDNTRMTRSISDGGDSWDTSQEMVARNVLYQNTPNPFKEKTTIRFSLADDAISASICIFDMTGKMLKKLPVSSGETSTCINGWELGEGMFFYTLIVNGREVDTKRMIITK